MPGLIKATESDLQDLYSLYREAAERMRDGGLNQWNWGIYPTEEMIRGDVARGELYIAPTDGGPVAAIALTETMDPEYAGVPWTGGMRPGIFHRLAVRPSLQGAGIGGDILDDAIQILRRAGGGRNRGVRENGVPEMRNGDLGRHTGGNILRV